MRLGTSLDAAQSWRLRSAVTTVAVLAWATIAPAVHPARNGRIAYLESCAVPGSLVVIAPDGSGKAPAAFAGIQPAWSPDGTRVAYWNGGWIWVANADGTEPTALAVGDNPTWSPDGTAIAIGCNQASYPASDICRVDVDSGTVTNLTNDGEYHGGVGWTVINTAPSWSPDPADPRIAFYRSTSNGQLDSVTRGIFTIDPTGGGLAPLRVDSGTIGATGGYAYADPDWSPDGTQLVLQRRARIDPLQPNTPDNTEEFIAVVDANGSGFTRLSPPLGSAEDDQYPNWSPDGTTIAFLSDRGDPVGLAHLWVMDADGANAHQVTAGPACNTPAWEIPPEQVKLGKARMTITDWRGEAKHEFELTPARATRYGRTVVPVHLRMGVAGEAVTLRATPEGATAGGGFGFSTDPDTVGPIEYPTTMGQNGELDLFFVVENLYAEAVEDDPVPTAFTITATPGTGPPAEAWLDVVDNRARILSRYSIAQDYVPDGARSVWRDAFLPPLRGPLADLPGALLSAIVQPGNIGAGSILCNTYQSRTLVFLNDLRHSDDGWLLNGLDYAPLQTQHTEHHFVALYPSNEAWAFPRTRILDPWLPQTVAVYTWQEFVNFVDTFGQGANIVTDTRREATNPGTCVVECGAGNYLQPPYPALGGRYPYFPENETLPIARRYNGCLRIPPDWCARNGYGTPAVPRDAPPVSDHATVVVGSPVLVHVALPDGRAFGWETPTTFRNDFADEFTAALLAYPEPGDDRGWYVEVPPGRAFELTTTALEDGLMSVAVVGSGGVAWGVHRNVPVAAGTATRIAVDLDEACAPLPLDTGDTVACELPPTACAAVPACRDADPCTDDGCTAGLCSYTPRTGLGGARCICERNAPVQCATDPVPAKVGRKADAACRLLAKADGAEGRKRRRLLTRAAAQWNAAKKTIGGRKAKRLLSAGCTRAMTTRLDDARERALAARTAD